MRRHFIQVPASEAPAWLALGYKHRHDLPGGLRTHHPAVALAWEGEGEPPVPPPPPTHHRTCSDAQPHRRLPGLACCFGSLKPQPAQVDPPIRESR